MPHRRLNRVNTTAVPTTDQNTGVNNASFKITTLYFNRTNSPIAVTHRNNLSIEILPTSPSVGEFVVRTIFSFSGRQNMAETRARIANYIQQHQIVPEDLKIIARQLDEKLHDHRHSLAFDVVVDHRIKMRGTSNGAVYITEDDILLCSPDNLYLYPHPNSQEGLAIDDYLNYVSVKKAHGFLITIVDNESAIEKRFIFLAGQVLEVLPIKDEQRPSGVYYQWPTFDDLDGVKLQPQFISITDAEKHLGLHKTREEAEVAGNSQLLAERERLEIKQLDTDLTTKDRRHKLEIDQLTRDLGLEHARAMAAMKEESVIREHQHKQIVEKLELQMKALQNKIEEKKLRRKDRMEGKSLSRKEKFEKRSTERQDKTEENSHFRKNVAEIVKYTPAVVLAVLGAMAYFKNKD